jgi:hypothetical protein
MSSNIPKEKAKALEIAISLGDEEPKIAEREAADIRAFLELDQAMRSEAAGRALAARLREGRSRWKALAFGA